MQLKISPSIQVICVILLTCSLKAASVVDITYTSNGSSITITDCDPDATGGMNIPSTIDGLPVTSIASSAFRDCDELTSVIIPDSVTSLGNSAFRNCDNIASATIGDGVQTISTDAFSGNNKLTSVTFGSSIRTIGDRAFQSANLENVSLPESLQKINDYAFSNNPFSTITLGANVATVESRAFSGCDNLTAINVANTNTHLSSSNGALFSKDQTILFLVPNAISGTFTTPPSVIKVGENAFRYTINLDAVILGDNVTEVEYGILRYNNCVTTLSVGSGLATIGYSAFIENALESITVSNENSNFSSENGILYNKDKTELIVYPTQKTGESYVIPETVNAVLTDAFNDIVHLESVTIPEGVTELPYYAFSYCIKLKTIDLPSTLEELARQSIKACNKLQTLTIPAEVNYLASDAIHACYSLDSVIFEGNAPTVESDSISSPASDLTIYAKSNATGFGTTFLGYPVVRTSADYTVTFNYDSKGSRSGGGASTQTVLHGESALTPTVSAYYGWVFLAWDQSFSSVTSNQTITAIYGPTLNNAGPEDDAVSHTDREAPTDDRPSTVALGSLTVNSDTAFTLGAQETLTLSDGPLTISSGASFTANGLIDGDVINNGLLRVPVIDLPSILNTGTLYVVTEVPTTITRPLTLNDGGYTVFTGERVTIDTELQANSGVLATESSLEITGNFEQSETGTLRMFLSGPTPGTEYSQLETGGDASIAGEFQIVLRPDDLPYLPTPNTTFDFVFSTAGTVSLDPSLVVTTLVENTQLGAFNEDSIAYSAYDSGLGNVLDPDSLVELDTSLFTIAVVEGGTILRATYIGPDLTDFYTNAPSDIIISSVVISEEASAGSILAYLVATDAGEAGATFSLVNGDGNDNNHQFSVVADELRLATALNFESGANRSIRLRATSSNNRYLEKIFNIVVINSTADDDDNDGLTEAEEIALGTSALNNDSDGDGLSDGDEQHGWGTNPLNANDRFEFSDKGAIEIEANSLTIRWKSRVGKTYKMEGNVGLDAENWEELPGTVPGTGNDVSFSTTLTKGGYQFFRVKVID